MCFLTRADTRFFEIVIVLNLMYMKSTQCFMVKRKLKRGLIILYIFGTNRVSDKFWSTVRPKLTPDIKRLGTISEFDHEQTTLCVPKSEYPSYTLLYQSVLSKVSFSLFSFSFSSGSLFVLRTARVRLITWGVSRS